MAKCNRCECPLPKGKYQCPTCKYWSIGPSTLVQGDGGTVLLCDVKEYQTMRYKTGMIDPCLGGGLVLTSVVLLGGEPGAGKSTTAMQLASTLAHQTKREALYIAAEQPLKEIKITAQRLGIDNMNQIRMLSLLGETNADLQSTIERFKPCVAVLDSLTGLVGDDHAAAVEVCKALKTQAGLFETPMIVISQINKNEDFAGLMSLQHEVDVLMMLRTTDDGLRMFEVPVKNRFGSTPMSQTFKMTEHGLVEVFELEEGEDEDGDDEDEEEGDEDDESDDAA